MKRSYKRVLFVGLIAGCLAFSTGCSKVELDYHNGLAVYEKHGKMGAVDEKKKTVIPFEYDLLGTFDEDVTWMEKSGKYGLVDKNGMVVVAPQYDSIGSLDEEIVRVEKNGLFGFIDKKGNVVVDLTYEVADDVFYDGLACVAIADGNYRKFGFISPKGEMVIEPKWDVAKHFGEGLAPVAVRTNYTLQWGYIDTTGEIVIPLQYRKASAFSEELAAVKMKRTDAGEQGWVYIDTNGNIVLAEKGKAFWRDVTPFHEGYAWISTTLNDVTAFINKNGELTFPKSGRSIAKRAVSDFVNGYAQIDPHYYINATHYIDTQGNLFEEAPDSATRPHSEWSEDDVWLDYSNAEHARVVASLYSSSSSSSSTSSSTSSSSSTKKNTCGYCGRSFDITSADGKSITRRHLCTKCYSTYNVLKDFR